MTRGGSTPRPRHVPQRTCVACRQGRAKRELVRVVRTAAGAVELDPTGKKSGRGAYLCRAPECWEAGLKRGVLPRALKLDTLPEENLALLRDFSLQLAQPRPASSTPASAAPAAS